MVEQEQQDEQVQEVAKSPPKQRPAPLNDIGDNSSIAAPSEEPAPVTPPPALSPNKVLDDLLKSEREYVHGLHLATEGFIKPLYRWADELQAKRDAAFATEQRAAPGVKRFVPAPDLSHDDVSALACNIEEIAAYHTQLLVDMEKAHAVLGPQGILRELRSKAPASLALHSTYIYNFDASREKLGVLDSRFAVATFLKACELQASTLSDDDDVQLRDLLLLPVLQIVRYTQVPALKNDKSLVALNRLGGVADRILNDAYRWGRRDRVLNLHYAFDAAVAGIIAAQPLIKEGTLKLVCESGPVAFRFLLFKDVLMFGYEAVAGPRGRTKIVINQGLDLTRSYVVDGLSAGGSAHDAQASFMLMSPHASFVVTARDAVDRATWVAAISGVILAYKESLESGGAQVPPTPSGGGGGEAAPSPASGGGHWVGGMLRRAAQGIIKTPSAAAVAVAQSVSSRSAAAPERWASFEGDDLDASDHQSCIVWTMSEGGEIVQRAYHMPGTTPEDQEGSSAAEFSDVLSNSQQRAVFRKHLEASHCSENLVFYEMVTEFRKKGFVGQQQAMVDAALAIVDRFVREGSPDQVNISATMRNQVVADVDAGRVTIDIFEDALHEVLKMLETDSFHHFYTSTYFAELLELRLSAPDLEPKDRSSGVIKFQQLVPDVTIPTSPAGSISGSTRPPLFVSPIPSTSSAVGPSMEPFSAEPGTPGVSTGAAISAMDTALAAAQREEAWSAKTVTFQSLAVAQREEAWSAKDAPDADDWLRKFIASADNFPACIVVSEMTQPGAPMIFVNDAFCRVTGYSKEESIGRNCKFLQGPDTEPEAIALIQDKLSKGQDCHVKLTNYRKNGDKFQNLLSMKPVFDINGIYRYVIGVQFEVIPNKNLKRRLSQLDAMLHLMPGKLQNSVQALKPKLRQRPDFMALATDGNPTVEAAIAKGSLEPVQSETKIKEVTETSASLDNALSHASAAKIWSSRTAADANDWLRKFTTTSENFPACIVVSDMTQPGAPMIFVNHSFCRVTGYSKEESIGRNCKFLQGPETEPEAVALIQEKLAKAQDVHVRITNYRKNGEKFVNLLSMKPVFDVHGIYRYVIGVQFEVMADTGLKKRLAQLERLLNLMPTKLQTRQDTATDDRSEGKVDLLLTAIGAPAEPKSAPNASTPGSFFGPSPRGFQLGGMLARRVRSYGSAGSAAAIGSLGIGGGNMEHALASGSKAWSSKSAETAEEWLKKFMAAAETFPACIVVSDMTQPGAPMIFVNDAFCRVTGYSKEETVGRNCRFLQGPDTEPEAVATIRSTLSKGQNCHVKITNYRKNGDRFQNLLSMKPVFDANGIYRYVIGVQFEVVADRTLKKRLGHLDKLLKSMPNKLQGKQKGASQRRSELMYLAVGASNVKQAVAAGRLSQEELDASRAAAMAESSGSLDTALNTVSNTKAWSTKNATDADDWLKAFIATADSFPACIVVSDMTQPGAPMIFVNDAFCKVTGYSKEETVGRNCRFLQGPDTEPEAIALIRSTLSQGQDCHVKLTNYRKNGEKFQNLLSMKPVFDANGIYRYVIGVQFEVVADKGLKRRLSQLDKLLTMMPSKLQTKANATSESDVDLLLVAVGGQTPEGPSAPAGAPQSTVSVTRTKSSDAAALESALNAVSRRNLWGAKTTADADTWLSKFTGTAENFPSCIVVSDMTIPGAPMVFVNKQFCMVTGYSKEETVGRNCRFLQGPDTEPEAVAVIRDKLGKGLDCHVKMTNYRKNGEKFQNLLSMKPVFDAEGVYRYVIGVQFEVVADEGLKKRLGQLERLLRLMPTRLQVKPSGVPAEALAPDAETARLMGQANLVIQSLGTLPAQA